MTGRLRDTLHRAADDLPGYQVYERAVATARRSRRRTAVGAAAAVVLVLCALVLASLPGGPVAWVDVPAASQAALPDRVGLPVIGTLRVTDRPRLGPAAVLFSGQASGLGTDGNSTVALVGAGADRYRVFTTGVEAPAGAQVLLSPDGRRFAYPAGGPDGPRLGIVDLVSGRTRRLPSAVPGSVLTTPVGWSPDGRRVVVRDSEPVDAQRSGYESVLRIVDLDSGRWTRLGTGDSYDGFSVAFAPDGTRLAYQVGGRITVADLNGRTLSQFDPAPGTALAGKGAWTPDGASLTVVARQGDSWVLRYVDPVTGAARPGPGTAAVSGVTAIRLLGWRPDHSALVVAYQPETAAPTRVDGERGLDQRTAYGNVRSVRVLSLAPGASVPVTVLTAPEQVLAIDVADNVIESGHVRGADPPTGVGPRFWFWSGVLVAVAAALLFGAYRLRRGRGRIRRWWRPRA
ncbi:MAG TPA: hypothetical protein VGJ07_06200 [Rugosimonospora sp.]